LDVAGPLLPDPLVEVLSAVAGPVAPVLPDWVTPVVLALPDLAPELEFEVVLTEPDCPPLPESPETATGLEEALPVSVEPVEPVLPEVAEVLPPQVPTKVRQGAMVMAGPELPEFPEFPEFPDVADPSDVADPVFPESALPDEAVVSLLLEDEAGPEVPPVVVSLAVESPLLPDVALALEPSLAFPLLPESAEPLALPDPLCGSDFAGPLLPEPLVEVLPAVAGPVAPVLPDWVIPVALALPDWAPELEFDVVLTEPDCPPLPESPETATGLEEALPVSVEPVEPVLPEVAFWDP
jgi:hypothetical protein